jgi:uncharacterized protein
VPRRRCVGCGRIAPKSELLRIVAVAPAQVAGGAGRGRSAHCRAVLDARAVMPGRGAYLCRGAGATPDDACLALAARRGGIPRALRRAVPGGLVLNDSKLVESEHA